MALLPNAGALVIAGAILAAGPRAVAEPPAPGADAIVAMPGTMVVQWRAPRGCPGPDDFEARVRRLVGTAAAGTRVDVRIARVRGGFTLRLTLEAESGSGERAFPTARECAALVEAAAVSVALAIDPEALSRDPEAGATADETGAGTASDGSLRTAALDDERPPGARELAVRAATRDAVDDGGGWRMPFDALALSAAASGENGALPGSAGALVRGELAGLVGPIRLAIGLDYAPAREADVPLMLTEPAGTRISLLAGSLGACHRRWLVCLRAEAGRLRSRGFGPDDGDLGSQPLDKSELWVAAFGGLGHSMQLWKGLRFRATAEAGVPLSRPQFRWRESPDDDTGLLVHQPRPVLLRASAGLEVVFP